MQGTPHNAETWQVMPVSTLRTLIRQKQIEGVRGVWLAGASKVECLAVLISGKAPEQASIPQVPQVQPAVIPQVQPASNDLASVIAQAVQGHLDIKPQAQQLDEVRVKELIEEHAPKSKRLEVLPPGETVPVTIENPHASFPDLLLVASQRLHALLVGPAGSGKTTAAEQVAEALKLPYYGISLGPMTMQSHLLGYEDAQGKYHESLFVKAYKQGGVFMLDEIDAAGPAVLVSINMALANGLLSTPVGMVKRHPDFVCVAGANTHCTGADRIYVGRNPLDGATVDRFVEILWDYDEALESELAQNYSWSGTVQKYRANARKHGLKVVISPRASISGAKLLAAGMPQAKVAQMLIFRGLDKQAVSQIKGGS